MSDVYDIWLYPLQDWWRTVNEMSDFMSTGQMGNFIFHRVMRAWDLVGQGPWLKDPASAGRVARHNP